MSGQSLYDYCMEHEDKKYLLDEWDYEKNEKEYGISPKDIGWGNNKKVWWLCKKLHSYDSSIVLRVNRNDNCPYCSNHRVLSGFNDLKSVYPEIAKEWNYKRNIDLTPDNILSGSHKKVWWLCDKGHEFEQTVISRSNNGSNCPYCSGKKVLKGFNDLCTTHPEIAKDWHPTKNGDLTPNMVSKGSNKKVWWLCEICGYVWCTRIGTRICLSRGCPECAKKHTTDLLIKRASLNGNDLASNYLELLKDWDYDKNDILPSEVASRSNKKVWWKCHKCGYAWETVITSRTLRGCGCPQCAKEKRSSFPEQVIYYYLKQVYKEVLNGLRDLFVGKIELDIYIPEISTAIEYDGVAWHKDIDKDLKKNKLCKEKGIRLIRIREEGLPDIDGSINIFRKNNSSDTALEEVLNELFSLLGSDVDVSIERDRQEIYSQYIQSEKENSLAVKFPEIAKEWHPTKNENLTPENVSYGSNKKVWWLCSNGHDYITSIHSRTGGYKSGCPYCSGQKVLCGFNDLVSTNFKLLNFWNYEKNEKLGIFPENFVSGSTKRVWWRCSVCEYEYERVIREQVRIKGIHCPECAKKNRKS